MNSCKKILKWLDSNLEPIFIVSIISVMSVVVVLQVIMRYVFHNAFSWAEEITRYLFIWIIYIGISYSARTRRHIRVTFLIHSLPISVQKVIILLGDVIFLIYLGFVVAYGIRLNINTLKLHQITSATGVSYTFVYASIVVCSLLTAIRIFQNIYNKCIHWNIKIPVEKKSKDWKDAFEEFLWISDAETIFHRKVKDTDVHMQEDLEVEQALKVDEEDD